MLRVPVHKIQPGMILARPIPLPHDPYRYLLQRDVEIPMDLVPRLQATGDPRGLGPPSRSGVPRRPHRRGTGRSPARSLPARAAELRGHHPRFARSKSTWSTSRSRSASLFEFLKGSAGSGILLQKLDAFDNYLMSHSTNVCYLSLLVGMKLERYLIEPAAAQDRRGRPRTCTCWVWAACCTTSARCACPKEILNKPGRLTPREMAEMQRHTIYGYEMVKDSVPASAAQVVLNHHQRLRRQRATRAGSTTPRARNCRRWTGGRFPSSRGSPSWPTCTTRPPRSAATPRPSCRSRSLHEMRTICRGFFDPVVEAAFYRTVPAFPIGQVVTLSNGIEAVVVDFSPEFPTRPKVQCLRTARGERFAHPSLEEIDLSLHPDLGIAAVDGQDVRPFLASQEVAEPMPALV